MPASFSEQTKCYKALFMLMLAFFTIAILCFGCLNPQEAEAKTVKIKLSAVGDCALCTDTNGSKFDVYFNKYGPDYFFKKVKPFFVKDDITLANFESTLTTATKRKIKTYNFKGPASYAKIIKNSSIEVVNLANNHSRDFLQKGFNDTKATLKANGIPYCFKTIIAYKKVKGVKMAFLGFNGVEIETYTKKQVKTGIERAKKKGAKIIVVSMHWGHERQYMPTAKQKSFGRFAIDCGASVVIGHHPHVLQGIEKYNGRCIVYSLGNFCFGGNSNFYDKDTMIFQQTFTVKNGKLTDSFNANVIPCRTSGDLFANDFQPCVPAEKKYKTAVMNKIRALCKITKCNVTKSGRIK